MAAGLPPSTPPLPPPHPLHTQFIGATGIALGIAGAVATYLPQIVPSLPPKEQAVAGVIVSIAGLILAWLGKGPLSR